jgi:hypothetical protein
VRVPNGQSVSLMYNLEHAAVMAGDVLRRCDEQFETAASSKKLLHFELTDTDLRVLGVIYPKIRTANEQVRTFLNWVILRQLKMPYELSAMLSDDSGHKFSCRARRANPVLE